ncbi:hypothetical protein BGZ65_008476 [Modicella reniformis]|uniref:Uncharacterized protein n=1 Tax=Modicella reniformis TaxID=1440133 RepID=A0A9P6J6W7_9FUNG|nr:hypothetical protein BGZ65_008476 [Modicella reniformis]
MKFSLKAVALSALIASAVVGAPVNVEKRDAASDRIVACFVGLIFTGAWPGSCKAAVAVNLGLIRSIAINQMTMDFTPANAWTPNTSSNDIVATMLSIPGITLPINSVRQHIILTDGNVQLGNIDTPWSAASVKGGALSTSFSSSPLNVFPTSKTAFSNFVSSLSTKASHPVTLQGSVDAKLNLGIFGSLTIPGIGFKATTTFAGLDNLKGTKYVYMIDTVLTEKFIYLTSVIKINNPSKLTLFLGDVAFSTSTNKGYVGISSIRNLKLVPGENFVLSYTDLDVAYPASAQFLNDLAESDVTLNLNGFNKSSNNVALNAGLAAIKSDLVVPGNFAGLTISQAPFKDFSLKVLPTTKNDLMVEVTATFQSPYYGFGINMIFDNEAGQDNYAFMSTTVPSPVNGMRLFSFRNTLKFSTTGSGSTTVTFKVPLAVAFTEATKAKWTALVNYGKTNGNIPIKFNWYATIGVDNDGKNHPVDWSNTGTGLGDIKVAVGSDFANILSFFP